MIYTHPFQDSHVISSGLLNGKNLFRVNLCIFLTYSSTPMDFLSDTFELRVVCFQLHFLLCMQMCIDACDL